VVNVLGSMAVGQGTLR